MPESASNGRYLVVGGGGQDAGVGQGSLTLDHLDGGSDGKATILVNPPELMVVADGLHSRDSVDSTDLRTPVPGDGQERYFADTSAQSNGDAITPMSNGGRSRANTTSGEPPNGLHALASLNSSSSLPAYSNTLDPTAHTQASLPPSRSTSRPGSRSSSINSQQRPVDSLRPPSIASPASKPMLKKQKSAQGGIAGALAYSGVALASPSSGMRQPLTLARVPTQGSINTRDSMDTSEDERYGTDNNGLMSVDQLGDFDDVVSQLGTGYAVASSKRNAEFHAIFKNIPDDDYLIEGALHALDC